MLVGTRAHSSHVKGFSGLGGGLIFSALAYEDYTGGVSIAAGDLNEDGYADVVVGSLIGSSHVKAFRRENSAEVASFLAYDPGYAAGIDVFAAGSNRDGLSDIGTATKVGFHYKAFAFPGLFELRSFFTDDAG